MPRSPSARFPWIEYVLVLAIIMVLAITFGTWLGAMR